MDNNTREQFGSRLGYILVSAGCAIGIGNVWKLAAPSSCSSIFCSWSSSASRS